MMAREADVTYEQFVTEANAIKAEGRKVTARGVREALGAGGMGTILKYLQKWREGQTRLSQAIDDTLDPAVVKAISNQIAARIEEATAASAERLAEMQGEMGLLISENERQSDQIESLENTLHSCKDDHAALSVKYGELENTVARLTGELEKERSAAESARIELAKAELRLEAVPRIETEIEKVRAELLEARRQAAENHEAAAVANAKLEVELAHRGKG